MPTEDMYEELIIAGHGGQGIILIGKLLAQAAMRNGMEITYMPAYGAEVRGGSASCAIVIASEPIASPVVEKADSLITMNRPSFDRFVPRVKAGGLIVMNSSLIDIRPERSDVELLPVPADEIAIELGSPRSANMVALGALIQQRGMLSADVVMGCLPDVLARRHHKTLPVNEKAIRCGMEFAAKVALPG